MVTLDQGGRGVHWQRLVAPSPALRPFVEYFWIQTRPASLQIPGPWRVVPDLSAHVIVHRGSEDWSAPRLVGPRAVYVDVPVTSRRVTVGCRFRPGALAALYGIPASELTDRGLYLSEVGRRPFSPDNATAEAVIEALERVLTPRFAAAPIDPRAIRFAQAAAQPRVRIASLASELGCSERSLRRFADVHLGMAPKSAARIGRLQKVFAASLPQDDPQWTAIAIESGYADQAHLIRDTRELLGETPAQYWARGR